MSLIEKHRLIELVTTAVVWGLYFLHFAHRLAEGALGEPGFIIEMGCLFVMGLAAVVIMEVILTVIARRTTSHAELEARDEREAMAGLKASRASHGVLIALLLTFAGGAYLQGLGDQAGLARMSFEATRANLLMLGANVLLACVILAELMRFGLHLTLLRRGR